MPNVCDNRLAISGPPDAVRELVRSVGGPEEPFDFETLMPVPAEMLGPEGRQPGESGLPLWYEWARTHWGVKWNAWEAADKVTAARVGSVTGSSLHTVRRTHFSTTLLRSGHRSR